MVSEKQFVLPVLVVSIAPPKLKVYLYLSARNQNIGFQSGRTWALIHAVCVVYIIGVLSIK